MDNFFAELKRRHIYRVAAAYAVVAWLLLQLFNNITPILKLPDWAGVLVLILLIGGFPIALLFAWIYQVADKDAAPRPATTPLDYVLTCALIAVIALISYQQLSASHSTNQQASVDPAAPARQAGISIAVLPFANLSGDATQEFFSDGMTEEITSALAKVQGLTVLARTSAFEFKGQNRNVRAIGEALNARYLVEGSVRKDGNRVRITAQLVQADSGANVWTENYDRRLTDVFATQEDIAQAIVGALKVPLGLAQGEVLVRDRTANLDSYQEYLRARARYRARAVIEAVTVLEAVVAQDPNYAPAWSLLAEAYALVPNYPTLDNQVSASEVAQSSYDKAERAAREAMRLDPRQAGAHAALAYVGARRRDWTVSDDLYRQALALDPYDPDALELYGLTLSGTGQLKKALATSEMLRTLEPFVPVYIARTGFALSAMGRIEESIAILEGLSTDPAIATNRNVFLAMTYAEAGRYADAAGMLEANPEFLSAANRKS